MCGICGIYYFTEQRHVAADVLHSMTATMLHRGPDDAGFHCDGPIGMGVRRLSILDKSGSQQPIFDEDKRLCLICNGEIYNFRDLRTQLLDRHHFRSEGDAETILHLYEEDGLLCVTHLRGMFAFALWDSSKQQLTLAVDRFGKKPLYYAIDAEKILFASELKALLRYPGLSRDIDYQALDEYLANGFISAPRSIYRGIRRLAPAQIMTIAHNGVSHTELYWEPNFAEYNKWDKRPINDCAAELRSLLTEAVRLRMTSDVPIGAFLSGGVDSTAVVALMTQLSTVPIKTFSIGFSDTHYDESPFAKAAVDYFGSDHHSEIIHTDQLGVLPDLIRHFDEPFADSSMIPTYLVSRLARQEVTVALSGDGGDEVFAGYHQHLYGYRQHVLQTLIPTSLRPLMAGFGRILPSAARVNPYLAALDRPAERWLTSGFFSAQQRNQLYSFDMRSTLEKSEVEQLKSDIFRRVRHLDELSQLQYYDLTRYLPNDILVKVDRASMLASLEVRSPLLDHKVFEFMARLPPHYRMSLMSGKLLLKKALAPLLPPFIHHRKKQGFSIPQAEWLRGTLNSFLREVLSQPHLQGIFDQSYIQQLIREHSLNQIDHKDRLWALLCFELWACDQV
ncbi:MAG: asparagine synthase (glutamine-hydrolyzing) [Chloroflexota bacterium]